MLDLIIRGGRVVTPEGAGEMEVGIQGEQIAFVASPGTLDVEARRIIDASGKIVEVAAEQQLSDGMYMIGQVATLRDAALPIGRHRFRLVVVDEAGNASAHTSRALDGDMHAFDTVLAKLVLHRGLDA